MITPQIRHIIKGCACVFVASADATGLPHIAIGEQVIISDDSLLIFENWFCPTTLQNISVNPKVSVVAVEVGSGEGYQLIGLVLRSSTAAILNGYDPSIIEQKTPQVLTRFTVKVDKILQFTGGIHTDIPLNEVV